MPAQSTLDFPTQCEPWHDKTNKMSVRPAKTQISLGIRPVWSESSLSAWRKLGSLATQWAHSEDSDQTGWTPRLIWVFTGHTVTLLVLSCRGSCDDGEKLWVSFLISFSHFLCSLGEIDLKLTTHITLGRIDLTKHVCYSVWHARTHVIPWNENIFYKTWQETARAASWP